MYSAVYRVQHNIKYMYILCYIHIRIYPLYSIIHAYIHLFIFDTFVHVQVEIDEYRDYEKAIGAYREAVKYLRQATTDTAINMISNIENRIGLIEKFVKARNVERDDPALMVTVCEVRVLIYNVCVTCVQQYDIYYILCSLLAYNRFLNVEFIHAPSIYSPYCGSLISKSQCEQGTAWPYQWNTSTTLAIRRKLYIILKK